MFKLLFNVLVILTSLLFASIAHATTLSRLYEVSVPVYSQSQKERKAATVKAFEELLIRITGKRDILGESASQTLLSNSRRFVRSFRYEILPELPVFPSMNRDSKELTENNNANDVETGDEEESDIAQATQKIIVSFDEKAVKNSLWKAKLPVWGKTRPTTLFWVAIQDQQQRTMLDASESTEIISLLKQHTEKRGVPVIYPNLDTQDKAQINVTDVWGGYNKTIQNASLRYQPEAIISAKIFLDGASIWQSHWTLNLAGDETSWKFSSVHLNELIFESVDRLATLLAERYAQISSAEDDSRFLIQISGITNLGDYEKINRYLNSLSVVKRAELAQIQSSELVYELELRSHPKALKQAIALGKTLTTEDDPFATEIDPNRLNYRLRP